MRITTALAYCYAFAFGAFAQSNSVPARHYQVGVPLTPAAAREASTAGRRVASLSGSVDLPANFDARKVWPVLLICAPSGSSAVAAARSYTNVALAKGWIIVAVDGPRVGVQQDNNVFAWEMISSLLYHLRSTWPQSKQWPFAVGGFSGGAKRASMVAAEMAKRGNVLAGVFMGGCNEDRATLGFQLATPPQKFLATPMYLSNGSSDPIASPRQGAAVKASMEATGFRNVRLEEYPGSHQLSTNGVAKALDWFLAELKR